jgi:hypothetical protein
MPFRAGRPLLQLAAGLALGLAVRAAEPVPAPTPLVQRLEQVRAQVTATPAAVEAMFHPDFLRAVPGPQVVAILKQYFEQGGPVVRVDSVDTSGEFFGEYRFVTEKGSSFPVKIGVEPAAPHRITTLWFGLVQPGFSTAAEVVEALVALPGQVSFALWRLGGEQPAPLAVHEPDRALAIGSTFKLYILGALVEAVEGGSLAWEQVVELQERHKSWPSGQLHTWPAGSPVTVHSLAAAMISVSDNTATDQLLFLAGRHKVEGAQQRMGHAKPALNVPFLATREMFRIKELGKSDERVAAYLELEPAARRAWLDGELAALGRDGFAGIDQISPTAVDSVEWFASAADLCRAMDWLRRHTESGKAAAAREILAINPGLKFSDEDWPYVGYKGGSETGVLNLTWLLQRKDGAWFALSAGWNDTAASLDEKRFFGLLQSLVDLVGAGWSAAASAP